MTRFLIHFEKAGGNENPLAFGIIGHGTQMSTVSRMRIHQISEKYRGSCEFIGSKSVYKGEAPKNE